MKKFKDMKISQKLITGFLIVSFIATIIGVTGIIGIQVLNNADTKLYELQTAPLVNITNVIDSIAEMRVQLRTAVISAGNKDALKASQDNFNAQLEIYKSNVDKYRGTINSAESKALYAEAEKIFDEEFMAASNEVYKLAGTGDMKGAYKAITDRTEITVKMIDNFDQCFSNRTENAKETSNSNSKLTITLTIILIIVMIVGVIASILLGVFISKIISKPVNEMVEVANKLSLGDTDVEVNANTKDEIGTLAAAFNKMIDGIKEQAEVLAKIAYGNLAFTVTPRSDKDTMGISLVQTVDALNEIFSEINQASVQVSEGSEQVSYGAQALSQGATEQASTIEELSASLFDISTQINQNNENEHQNMSSQPKM